MKRTLACLLLVAQMVFLAGPALAVHHGEPTGHSCCHELKAPGNELVVEGPTECAHCAMDDCATRSSCTGVTTAIVTSGAMSFVEEFVKANRSSPVSRQISAALISDQPPPRA